MKSNELILHTACKYFDLGITESEALGAMKEAQIEILDEVVERFKFNHRHLTVWEIINELIEVNDIEEL